MLLVYSICTLILIFTLGIYIVIVYSRKGRVNDKNKQKYSKLLKNLEKEHPEKRIISYDSILDDMLGELGYTGNLGEKLKKKPHLLKGILDDIWKMHKLRNKLAHEVTNYENEYLEREASKYEGIIKRLLES